MTLAPHAVPAADACHIWLIPLDAGLPGLDRQLLDDSERARAARFRVPRDRERFAVCHCAVRHILGGYLRRDPARLTFEAGEHGRPRMAVEGERACIDFNLTHSGDLALLAIVAHGPIGVDVEALREVVRSVALARRYMTVAETDVIEAASAAQRSATFLTCWTRKEAVLKSSGAGLTLAPRSIEVGASAADTLIRAPLGSGERLRVRSFVPREGYVGACVTDASIDRIELRELGLS
jgi:4'-phosphopantetheinyl transferase